MNVVEREEYTLIEMPADMTRTTLEKTRTILPNLVHQRSLPIVLDLARVKRIYSLEISAMVRLYKEVQSMSGEMFVVNVLPQVANVFRSVKLERVIPFFSTLEEFEMEKGVTSRGPSVKASLEATLEREEKWTFVCLQGSISYPAAAERIKELVAKLEKHGPCFLFSFKEVHHIDSQGLAFLIDLAQESKNKNGVLVVAEANETIKDLLVHIFNLSDMITFFDSTEEARAFLRRRRAA